MTRETRIGLIVGLAFIVLFGVVLTELGPSGEAPDDTGERVAQGFYARAPMTAPPRPQPQGEEMSLTARRRTEVQSPTVVRETRQPPRRGQTTTTPPVITPQRVVPQRVAPTRPPIRGGVREMTIEDLARERDAGGRAGHSRFYVTRRGDNLTALARKFYRTPSRKAVMKIFNANRTILQSPDALGVGVKLVIPN